MATSSICKKSKKIKGIELDNENKFFSSSLL